jgi:hypothetical protein
MIIVALADGAIQAVPPSELVARWTLVEELPRSVEFLLSLCLGHGLVVGKFIPQSLP